jgi:hypothetical protein
MLVFRSRYSTPFEVWDKNRMKELELLDSNGYGKCN